MISLVFFLVAIPPLAILASGVGDKKNLYVPGDEHNLGTPLAEMLKVWHMFARAMDVTLGEKRDVVNKKNYSEALPSQCILFFLSQANPSMTENGKNPHAQLLVKEMRHFKGVGARGVPMEVKILEMGKTLKEIDRRIKEHDTAEARRQKSGDKKATSSFKMWTVTFRIS